MIVLIGHHTSQGLPETKGTGFLVSKGSQAFVVTCRHVVDGLRAESSIAIPNCRMRIFPTVASEKISLTNPVFHPNDDEQGSYDIAIYALQSGTLELERVHQSPIPFNALSNERLISVDTAAMIFGYSVSYLQQHFNPISDQSLPPECAAAHVQNAPLNLLQSSGLGRPIREMQFAHSDSGIALGQGASGSPVFRLSDQACIGIYIASVSAKWTSPTGLVLPVIGGAFVTALRVREAIEAA